MFPALRDQGLDEPGDGVDLGSLFAKEQDRVRHTNARQLLVHGHVERIAECAVERTRVCADFPGELTQIQRVGEAALENLGETEDRRQPMLRLEGGDELLGPVDERRLGRSAVVPDDRFEQPLPASGRIALTAGIFLAAVACDGVSQLRNGMQEADVIRLLGEPR